LSATTLLEITGTGVGSAQTQARIGEARAVLSQHPEEWDGGG
jgi:hypothetical protein